MSKETADIFAGIAIFLFGALLTHFWNRYRNRLCQLRWAAQYVRLAVAGEDANFGKVEVLYNGNPATNLTIATIQLENQSRSDLRDVEVNMGCFEGSTILVSMGFVAGSLQPISFTAAFSSGLANLHSDDLEYLTTRRDYLIPVLNRGGVANFTLLLRRNDVTQPNVTLTCNHLGVQLRYEQPKIQVFGVPQNQAILVGLFVSLALIATASFLTQLSWSVTLAAWVLGLSGQLVGVATVKLWRGILRALS